MAVLGAGWLGEPLARALAAAGHSVRVSTTTPARCATLEATGLPAWCLSLEPDSALGNWQPFFDGARALVVGLPPGARASPNVAAAHARYAARLARLGVLLTLLADKTALAVERVVLLSSTAGYPDLPGAPVLAENDIDSTHRLARAEAELAAALPAGVGLVVARLGGLMGPGRAPGRFFGPGRPVPQPDAPVNMLHLTDAIGAVRTLLLHPAARGAFGVCAASHPARSEFYTAAARALGLPAPALASAADEIVGKHVSSARLRQLTGYRFAYDDPLSALAAC